jgi:predicted amidophosphoribosyltransferase
MKCVLCNNDAPEGNQYCNACGCQTPKCQQKAVHYFDPSNINRRESVYVYKYCNDHYDQYVNPFPEVRRILNQNS